jgi:hypothetical protein
MALCDDRYLEFLSVGDADVYNPSFPLLLDNRKILPARVEPRNSERSKIVLFEQVDNGVTWKPAFEYPSLPLQDPFWTINGSKLLLGGVDVDFAADGRALGWKTACYEIAGKGTYVPFFSGPAVMKDLRFCTIGDGRIAVFTRPQGGRIAGRGQIGFMLLSSWNELSQESILQAPLLGLFESDEWGGVNHVQVLSDGSLGVLGHIACYSSGNRRHYYPMTFVLDPMTGKLVREPQIILERNRLLPGPSKRPDLEDVIFPGGCVQEDDGSTLYLGVSDARVQVVRMKNLFA